MNWIRKIVFIIISGSYTLVAMAQVDSSRLADLEDQVAALERKVNSMNPGLSSFLLTGFTNLTYHQDLNDIRTSRFDHAGFSPITLWRPTEKLFFEVEYHIEMEGGVHGGEISGGHGDTHGHGGGEEEGGHEGSTHFDLGYANMVYLLRPGIIITAGKFLTPIGIYNEKYHPTWINPLPVDPLGIGHGGSLPSAELGLQVRGGLQVGSSKVTYAVYVSNGPILEDGAVNNAGAGRLIYTNFSDNNGNKAIGGRFSWLPFNNGSLEIGVSGQYAAKVGDRGTYYEDTDLGIYAFDITYNKTLSGFALLRLTGQYNSIKVGDKMYTNTAEEVASGAPLLYTFDNTSTFYYGAFSVRPIQSQKNFIKNSELAFRYEAGSTPDGSKWHNEETRVLIGYNYWLYARAAFKLAVSLGDSNVLYAQFALGF